MTSLAFAQTQKRQFKRPVEVDIDLTPVNPFKVFANVDFNITSINAENSTIDAAYGFAVGGDAVYMLSDTIGVGLGVDYNMIKGSASSFGKTLETSVSYIDVPISFAYNWMPTPTIGFMFLAGPYIGIPMQEWKTDTFTGGTATADASMAYGANVETHATWELTQGFALGAHIGFKYAFNDMTETAFFQNGFSNSPDVKTSAWSLGLGASAKFF